MGTGGAIMTGWIILGIIVMASIAIYAILKSEDKL